MLVVLMTAAVISSAVFADDVKYNCKSQQTPYAWHHDGEMKALWNLLSEDKQKLLHDTMEKIRQENAAMHEQSRKLGEEIDASMQTAEFDKVTFLAKHAQLDALYDKMKANAEKGFASVAGQFTAEERKILVEIRHLREWHGFHHWDEHKNDMKSEDKANG